MVQFESFIRNAWLLGTIYLIKTTGTTYENFEQSYSAILEIFHLGIKNICFSFGTIWYSFF